MSNTKNDTPNIVVRLKYYSPSGSSTYSNRRSFYASTTADDYMKYIDRGYTDSLYSKVNNADYLNYVDSDVKSGGVFGADGLLSKKEKAEMRKVLRITDSVIWDMVVSFKEGYGDRYMRDIEAAQGLLKAQLNRFFKGAGLNPNNVSWFAGFHNDTDNSHIHVCFFEKEPMLLRRGKQGKHHHHGKLRQTGIDGLKIAIEQYFSDTAMQLKADRLALISATRESVNHDKKLKAKILSLANHLPPSGRLGYDSENIKPLHSKIYKITEYILTHYPPARDAYLKLNSQLYKRDKEIRESCRWQKIKDINHFLVKDKIAADLYHRIGNQVIGFAMNVRKKQVKNRQAKTTRVSLSKCRIARRDFLGSLRQCLKLKVTAETECRRAFDEYLERLARAAPNSLHERQQEQDELC